MNFHNDLMCLLLFVVCFVSFILLRSVRGWVDRGQNSKRYVNDVVHGTTIEVVWTVMPALLLCCVSVPSFALLYAVEESVEPELTVKVVGHQWYWSYEVSTSTENVEFDSYMVNEEDLEVGELRLLEVDNRLLLPVSHHIRLVIT